MPYELTIDVNTEGAPAPSRTVVEYDLPPGATEADAVAIARGIRRAFRDVFDTRVKVVGLQQTGLTRDVALNT